MRDRNRTKVLARSRKDPMVAGVCAGAAEYFGGIMNCPHQPPCPPADAPDCEAAHVVAAHPEQGWSLLCNGVVVFEDTGDLLPDGRIVAPHRAAA